MTKEKREKRAKLVADARVLIDGMNDETTADQAKEIEAKFDAMMAEADRLLAEIERLERLEDAEAGLQARLGERGEITGQSPDQLRSDADRETELFTAYMRGGMQALDDDGRAFMMQRHGQIQGAQTTGTDSSGGYLIPEGFRTQMEQAMLTYGGMRRVATVMPTGTGNDLQMPTANDTGNTGALLAENTQVTEQDAAFGSLTLNAYTYTSKLVRVPLQLLQDSVFDLNTYLANILGERIGRITNTHFTTGTRSSQPNGIVTASTLGKTGASGQTTSVIYDDLVDLQHSVDPSYRVNARWMFHDQTLKALKKLKDGDSRPLWAPGVAVREPDTILGDPYEVNQDVAVMAASAKSILYGDFRKYFIRDVLGVQLMRLVERYADYLQVGFVAFSRQDGDLLDAGTNPVKHYANAAS